MRNVTVHAPRYALGALLLTRLQKLARLLPGLRRPR